MFLASYRPRGTWPLPSAVWEVASSWCQVRGNLWSHFGWVGETSWSPDPVLGADFLGVQGIIISPGQEQAEESVPGSLGGNMVRKRVLRLCLAMYSACWWSQIHEQ